MTPGRILDRLQRHAPTTDAVAGAMGKIAAQAFRDRGYFLPEKHPRLVLALGEEIARVQASADMVARAAMWLDLKGPQPIAYAADEDPGDVPAVLPESAIEDLIARVPELQSSAEEVRKAYGERHAFAAAYSPSLEVAGRVQKAIRHGLETGETVGSIIDRVEGIGKWTRAYADTVVQTNATGAYAAGRLKEAEKMQALGLIAALEFKSVLHPTTRPNHAAAHNVIASVDDPIWERLSPPLGYQCRCALFPIDKNQIPKHLFSKTGALLRARVPAGAGADEMRGYNSFGRRPDRGIYGSP